MLEVILFILQFLVLRFFRHIGTYPILCLSSFLFRSDITLKEQDQGPNVQPVPTDWELLSKPSFLISCFSHVLSDFKIVKSMLCR